MMSTQVSSVKGADVVVLANDSASMGTAQDEWRWGETKLALERLAHVLEAVGNEDGYRVQFLNEGSWKHVRSPAKATQLFEGVRCDPKGSDLKRPIGKALKPFCVDNKHVSGHAGRDLIILVITDGSPTDVTAEQFRQFEELKKPNVYTTFIVANDVSQVDITSYYKPSDAYEQCLQGLPGVAVTGFYSWCLRDEERAGRKLSRDAWISRALLGAKVPERALQPKTHPDFTHNLLFPEDNMEQMSRNIENAPAYIRKMPIGIGEVGALGLGHGV